jgi:uncharacterized damage-inducible protein DinB
MQTHRRNCPIHGCHSSVRGHYVMCPHHWFDVSGELRKRIWNLYQTQRGSTEHLAAIQEAIDEVNEQHSVAGAPAA